MTNGFVCAILMGWAAHLSGYAQPPDCPEMRAVDRKDLQEVVCDGGTCRAAAHVHYDEPDVVYFWTEMHHTNPLARSVIVHEMVHVLQLYHGVIDADSSCEDKVKAEQEAYRIQEEYLITFGRMLETAARFECH